MKHSTFFCAGFFRSLQIFILLASILILNGCNSEIKSVRFGSGNKGGVYHQFAENFSRQFNQGSAINKLKIEVKTTSGTQANIRLMEEGFLDLAIVQSDVLQSFLMRTRMRHPIAAVAALYTESIQIVVLDEGEIKTVADLQGKRISVGEEESGIARNAEIILNAYGIPYEKIQRKNLSLEAAAKALESGEIDAFFCTAGIPTPSINELARHKKVRLLSLDSSDVDRILNLHEDLVYSEIPAGTYEGQEEAVRTLGTKAVLIANLMTDDKVIQKTTEALFSSELQAPAQAPLTPESATRNMPLEFHPGAAAFYKTKNISVDVAAPLQGREPIPSTGD